MERGKLGHTKLNLNAATLASSPINQGPFMHIKRYSLSLTKTAMVERRLSGLPKHILYLAECEKMHTIQI